MRFFGIVTIVSALLGAVVLFLGFATAKGAPQEAAVAALACALAVIPYVIFRALQSVSHYDMVRDQFKANSEQLDRLIEAQKSAGGAPTVNNQAGHDQAPTVQRTNWN